MRRLIRVVARDGSWRLTVKDDGIGLRPKRRAGGMGTHIMHYWAGMIGGTVEIRNAEGGGVIASCVVAGPQATPERKHTRLQKQTMA